MKDMGKKQVAVKQAEINKIENEGGREALEVKAVKEGIDVESMRQQRQYSRDLNWAKRELEQANSQLERRRHSDDPNYRDLGISTYSIMEAERDTLDTYVKALEQGGRLPRPDLQKAGEVGAARGNALMGEMMKESEAVRGRIQARSLKKQEHLKIQKEEALIAAKAAYSRTSAHAQTAGRPEIEKVHEAVMAAEARVNDAFQYNKPITEKRSAIKELKATATEAQAKAFNADMKVAEAKEQQAAVEKPSVVLHHVYDDSNSDIKDPKLKALNQKLLDVMDKRMDLKEGSKAWNQKIKQEQKASGDIKRYEQRVAAEKREVLDKLGKQKDGLAFARKRSEDGSSYQKTIIEAEVAIDSLIQEIDRDGAPVIAMYKKGHESIIKRMVIPRVEKIREAAKADDAAINIISKAMKAIKEKAKEKKAVEKANVAEIKKIKNRARIAKAKVDKELEVLRDKRDRASKTETRKWKKLQDLKANHYGGKAIQIEHQVEKLEKIAKTDAQRSRVNDLKVKAADLWNKASISDAHIPAFKTSKVDARVAKVFPAQRALAQRGSNEQKGMALTIGQPTLASRKPGVSNTEIAPAPQDTRLSKRGSEQSKPSSAYWDTLREFRKQGMDPKAAAAATKEKLAKQQGKRAVKAQKAREGVNKLPRQGSRPQKGKEAKAKAHGATQKGKSHKTTTKPNILPERSPREGKSKTSSSASRPVR